MKLGVLEEVPPNTPTTWCSRMVIQTKKNGKPRRVIDLQPVNKCAVRQTYSGGSPFEIVSEVPSNTFRTTLDAWNGYHSVPIKEEDRDVTTFITPWGRFRYRTTPQGFLAAQDGYNHRFDLITRDFEFKRRCVDDSIIWGNNIEEIFFRTCEYLNITGNAGIIMNPDKFVFGKKRLEFIGFKLTEEGIEPSKEMLKSIANFPKPKNLSGVRSWFGLVEQVTWAFSKTDVMKPIRHLLSPQVEFRWDEDIDRAFEASKAKIIEAIKTGVKTFDPTKITCLATDWCTEGIGFCLLQKMCACIDKTPTCCKQGWKLVFCGSKFTSPAESRYSPVEGECLAVAWSLRKAKYYVAGCENLIVAVDHKPLLGLLNKKGLDQIENNRLCKLKEKTMSYRFGIIHVPGLKNKIADAESRYPVAEVNQDRLTRTVTRASYQNPTKEDEEESETLANEVEAAMLNTISSIGNVCEAISVEDVARENELDKRIQELIKKLRTESSEENTKWGEEIKEFERERGNLSENEGIVMNKNRILIPEALRERVLEVIHPAHQGCSGMSARARLVIWWPKIDQDIERKRGACDSCTRIAPSQADLPPVAPASP